MLNTKPKLPLSREAQAILDGEWPRLPLIDFSNAELIKPIKEVVNDGYRILSETSYQECNIDKDNIGGVDCCWIYPKGALKKDLIVYIPGGGGIFGCPETHYSIAMALSFATKCRVLSVNYPKAPEHPYPEPQNAVEAVYSTITNKEPSSSVSLVADSFGASLAINLILRLRSQRIKSPNSLALICPFVDFDYAGDSYQSLCGIDPSWDNSEVIKSITSAHIANTKTSDPMLNVLNSDFHGFPHTFIQAASRDLILSDSIQLQKKLLSSEINVEYELWEGLWHDFHANQSVPEAREATDAIAKFINHHI